MDRNLRDTLLSDDLLKRADQALRDAAREARARARAMGEVPVIGPTARELAEMLEPLLQRRKDTGRKAP